MTDEMFLRLPRSPAYGRPMAGRVVLLNEIGRGAMGVVCAGWHAELGIPVAVKFLLSPGSATEERLARFRREARICAEIDEPALVRVLDFGREAEVPYLVMEWVPGRGLDRVIDDAGPLTETEALTVLRDVGQALLALHRRGVVHRDIKPSNLLLRAADGRIKMADLGIAKQAGSQDNIATQTVLGTPAYMSPEQVHDAAAVGPASDLFSLGSTVFTLLTGRLPFSGNSLFDTMMQVCEAALPHPVECGIAVSDATWELLRGLTEKDPAKRLADAGQLLERLPPASVPFRPKLLDAARPAFAVQPPGPTEDEATVLTLDTLPTGPRPASDDTITLPENAGPAVRGLLFCQCLQNDFIAPLDDGAEPPNKLHIGREEARRLVGPDPAKGPLVRAVSACARAEDVGKVYIRDWHDPDDPKQKEELAFFGPHCLRGTWGARFIDALEAYSRDRRRAAVIDAGGINDMEDTPALDVVDAFVGNADRAAFPVGVIGVWTDVKIHYLLYDLKTRARLHNLATCSALVASPNREAHEQTLRHLERVLNVKVFDDVDAFLNFLGVTPPTQSG